MLKIILILAVSVCVGCGKPKYLQGLPPIKNPDFFGPLFGQLESDGCVYSGTDRLLECPQINCPKCPKAGI